MRRPGALFFVVAGPAGAVSCVRLSSGRESFFCFASASCSARELLARASALLARVGNKRKLYVCLSFLGASFCVRVSLCLRPFRGCGGGALRPIFPWAACEYYPAREKRQLLFVVRPSSGRVAGRRRFRILQAERELPRRLRVYSRNIPRHNNTRRL